MLPVLSIIYIKVCGSMGSVSSPLRQDLESSGWSGLLDLNQGSVRGAKVGVIINQTHVKSAFVTVSGNIKHLAFQNIQYHRLTCYLT